MANIKQNTTSAIISVSLLSAVLLNFISMSTRHLIQNIEDDQKKDKNIILDCVF